MNLTEVTETFNAFNMVLFFVMFWINHKRTVEEPLTGICVEIFHFSMSSLFLCSKIQKI